MAKTVIQMQPLKQFGIAGPTSAIDNEVPVFDGTTGRKQRAGTGVFITATGDMGVGVSPTEFFHVSLPGAVSARTKKAVIEGNSGTADTPLLLIKQNNSDGNRILFKCEVNSGAIFTIDNEGDADVKGSLYLSNSLAVIKADTSTQYTSFNSSGVSKGFRLYTTSAHPERGKVSMGHGAVAQEPITSNKDWDDVLIKRDVDGAYTIDGNLLKLEMDITSETGGTVNYFNVEDKFVITEAGDVGFAITTPTAKADVNSDILRLRTAKTPATAGAAGNQGDICWDSSYMYVCTATNTWKRSTLNAW